MWLNFITDGQRRSRFLTAYENHGEVPSERTAELRYFDPRPCEVLASFKYRLVVEWYREALSWAEGGTAASALPVVEIADPVEVPFTIFDELLIS